MIDEEKGEHQRKFHWGMTKKGVRSLLLLRSIRIYSVSVCFYKSPLCLPALHSVDGTCDSILLKALALAQLCDKMYKLNVTACFLLCCAVLCLLSVEVMTKRCDVM